MTGYDVKRHNLRCLCFKLDDSQCSRVGPTYIRHTCSSRQNVQAAASGMVRPRQCPAASGPGLLGQHRSIALYSDLTSPLPNSTKGILKLDHLYAIQRSCQTDWKSFQLCFCFHFLTLLAISPWLCCIGFSLRSLDIPAMSSPCASTNFAIHSSSRELCCLGRFRLASISASCAA